MATLRGTSNADKLTGGSSADTISGFGGNDTLSGRGGKDELFGGTGDDRLYGGDAADRVFGESGDDYIDSGTAAQAKGDVVSGGSGTDTLKVDFTGTSAALSFTARAGSSKTYKLGDLSYTSIEEFRVTGGSGNDKIAGGSGDDVLLGGRGNDQLSSGDGKDLLDGGSGDDVVTFQHHYLSSGDVARGGTGNDTLVIGNWGFKTFSFTSGESTKLANGASISGFENVHVNIAVSIKSSSVTTGTGDDHIDAWVNDKISSGAGNDLVQAWHGSDTVNLGSGNDTVSTRYDGKDVFDGGRGTDTVEIDVSTDHSPYEGEPIVDFGDLKLSVKNGEAKLSGGTSTALYENFENIKFTGGAGDDTVTVSGSTKMTANGGGGRDTLTGGTSADVLRGGTGADVLKGGGGLDELYGDSGNDTLHWTSGDAYGGSGTDRVIVNMASKTAGVNLTFNSSGFTFLEGNFGFEQMESMEFIGTSGDDVVTGSSRGDTLSGRNGADKLNGAGGDDVINGGSGADELTGGAGDDDADTFVYGSLGTGVDTITDFASGTDEFRFSRSGLGLDSNDPWAVRSGGSATTAGAQFLFDSVSDQLKWDADGAGGDAAQLIATLTGVSSLSAGDFVLV